HIMLPLVAIGGVIGAIVSVAKGASWLSDQVSGSANSASAGGKGGLPELTEAQASSFAATLAAQGAGQAVPGSAVATAAPTPAPSMTARVHATGYDTRARLQAGTIAYSQIGQHTTPRGGGVNPQDDGITALAGS